MRALPAFYFTESDPDYQIKGARDPLGFQVLWQQQAKQLIPFLSTVSSDVHDFQVMCLAYHFYGPERNDGFVKFFLRFEQLMAYARHHYNVENNTRLNFGGLRRVNRKYNESTKISISNRQVDEILSNQRAYGVWGKYNRPFREIEFLKEERFDTVFANKIDGLEEKTRFTKLISQIMQKEIVKVDVQELSVVASVLEFTTEELSFYDDKLLKVNARTPYQNLLFDYVSRTPLPDGISLYSFLQAFKASPSAADDMLQIILTEIECTEKILSPLNRIFRYLQTRHFWTKKDLQHSTYIAQFKEVPEYVFPTTTDKNKTKNKLSVALRSDNWKLVELLVKRNAEVCAWRGGEPWLTIKNDVLELYQTDGGFQNPDYNPQRDFDNWYFLETYMSLYDQIVGAHE